MAIPVTEAEIAAVFAPKAKFSLGCMFAQVVVDTFFAGILTMQVMTYIKYQRNDSWWTKAIVIFAVTINLGITVYLWWFDQYLFVENFGLWAPFAETKYLAPFPFLDSLNSGACQAFFTYRAWRLMNRNWVIPVVCGALILTSIGATLSVWIIFSSYESLFQAAGVSIPENLWLASIMSADIIITVSILTGLLRSKTGWSHTDRTITRLIRMTLESQVPPTFIAIAFMVEYGIEPSSLFGSTLQGIQPKFYVLGLMYTLNQRVNFRAQWATDSNEPTPMFAMSDRPNQRTIQVEMETETYVQKSETVAPHQRGLNRTNSDLADEKPKDLEAGSDIHTEVSYGSKTRLAK